MSRGLYRGDIVTFGGGDAVTWGIIRVLEGDRVMVQLGAGDWTWLPAGAVTWTGYAWARRLPRYSRGWRRLGRLVGEGAAAGVFLPAFPYGLEEY